MPIFARHLTTVVVSILLLAARPASGDVALKPRGENATPLRMKRITANAVLTKGRFATTDLDLVFQNTVHNRIEADFIYTVPEGAVVTDFAYFYGDERVTARVVEKERAQAIYHYITSRMRDPALVEMIGKNTFRARIFPVMPDADLRVQIRYVQALPVSKGEATYTLPVETARTERLESAQVTVTAQDSGGLTVRNNFGLPFTEERKGDKKLTVSASNWRTNKDLKISFSASSSILHEAFLAAPSGGKDGFFALSVAPSVGMAHPAVRFSGVTTYGIETTQWKGGLLFTGRYRGSGPATAVVSDGKAVLGKVPVTFSAAPLPNHPAVSLWASAHLARLSGDTRNMAEVIALSKRFNLPSKWTSWLAIPQEEIKRYKDEQATAELSVIASNLAHLIGVGRGRSAEATALRRRFQDICQEHGWTAEREKWRMQNALWRPAQEIAEKLLTEIQEQRENGSEARRLSAELDYLCKEMGQQRQNFLLNGAYQVCPELVQTLAKEILAHRDNGPVAQQTRRRLTRISRLTGIDTRQFVQSALQQQNSELARIVAREVEADRADSPEAQQARRELKRLCDQFSDNPEIYIQNAYINQMGTWVTVYARQYAIHQEDSPAARDAYVHWDRFRKLMPTRSEWEMTRAFRQQANQELYRVVNLLAEGKTAEAAQSREELHRLYGYVHLDEEKAIQQAAQGMVNYAAQQWAVTKYGSEGYFLDGRSMGNSTSEEVQKMWQRVQRLAELSGQDITPVVHDAEKPYKVMQYDRLPGEIAEERRKPQPDRKRIEEREAQFLELARGSWWDYPYSYSAHWFYGKNTPQGREAFARDRLARIEAREEGDQIDHLLAGTPDPAEKERLEAKRADLKRKEEEIHARMGDPLIQVAAPEDARSVVALMPEGDIKPLTWDQATRTWQARFDIPTYAKEGDYTITIIVVQVDGKRTTETRTHHVDLTPPTGKARITRLEDGRWLLSVETDEDTARITALLPWGETITLSPENGDPNRWFARVTPPNGEAKGQANFILTDRAHNRATLTAALEEGGTQ